MIARSAQPFALRNIIGQTVLALVQPFIGRAGGLRLSRWRRMSSSPMYTTQSRPSSAQAVAVATPCCNFLSLLVHSGASVIKPVPEWLTVAAQDGACVTAGTQQLRHRNHAVTGAIHPAQVA